MSFNYSITLETGRVALYINTGKDSAERNREIFDALEAHKAEIEKTYGEELEWDAVEGRSACRIRKSLGVGGLRDQDKWPAIHDAMIDAMVRLEKALRPHLKRV